MPDRSDKARLDAYLDGRMDSEERREFESRLAADPALRAALELQKRIDGALGRSAAGRPPDADAFWRRIAEASAAGGVQNAHRALRIIAFRRYAMAAVIVLAVSAGGSWALLEWTAQPEPSDPYAPMPWRSMVQVYGDRERGGWTCDWECKTDREFAATFWNRFGQSLLLAQTPPGVQSLGLAYANTLTPNTVFLVAKVDGRNVAVFIDETANLKEPDVPPASGLKVFRKQIGKLTLFELTPLDKPHLLDLFYEPAKTPGTGD